MSNKLVGYMTARYGVGFEFLYNSPQYKVWSLLSNIGSPFCMTKTDMLNYRIDLAFKPERKWKIVTVATLHRIHRENRPKLNGQ